MTFQASGLPQRNTVAAYSVLPSIHLGHLLLDRLGVHVYTQVVGSIHCTSIFIFFCLGLRKEEN